ncbi:hypothetical protein V1511DRAFT_493240 [Dipodascopsis uninucleata]
MSASTNLKLLHLQTAAYCLQDKSPEISSHLYKRFVDTAATNDVQLPDQLSRIACTACSTIWISGVNVKVVLYTLRSEKKKSINKRGRIDKRERILRKKQQTQRQTDSAVTPQELPSTSDNESSYSSMYEKLLCYICLRCGQITRFLLPTNSRFPKLESPQSLTAVTSSSDSNGKSLLETKISNKAEPIKPSANNSNKARQKLRKNNSLFQMLAKAKAEKAEKEEKDIKQMDLMNIMKSSRA